MMLSVAGAAMVFSWYGRDKLFGSATGILIIVVGALLHISINLLLVTVGVCYDDRVSLRNALNEILPKPAAGFWFSYALLTALGAATGIVYTEVDYGSFAVAAFLIPLIFARLSILGARAQQELSEKVRKQ